MAALRVVEPTEESADPEVAWLARVLDRLNGGVQDALDGVADETTDAVRVDRIAAMEALRGALAARQAAEVVRFARSQVAEQLARDVHPRKVGQGITEQIALTCHVSPCIAARRLTSARAWWFDLPETYASLAAGELSEVVAEAVVNETRHLDASTRRQVDHRLREADLVGMSTREALARTRRLAYEADPRAFVERGRTERRHRRVGLRPAPDTMAVLTGYLPVEQGVACLAALKQHTDGVVATGDDRTRDQIMADTLVERLTGQARAQDVSVELQIVMPLDAVLDPDTGRTATVTGAGPLPARLAREIVAGTQGRRFWRRLFSSPRGHLIDADPRRRHFAGALATLLRARDQTCRDPFCGAPIRHLDHIERFADGGPTTLANGRGACVRHNLVRELPGWKVHLVQDGLGDEPHTVVVRTPTGHSYSSRAPDPP